jgi:hypothetical protein
MIAVIFESWPADGKMQAYLYLSQSVLPSRLADYRR